MKKIKSFGDLVYSTNPQAFDHFEENEIETPSPEKQKLKISLDNKRRKGKTVTLITGFIGDDTALQDLGKKLKIKCGTGGSAKDGEIIIQGNCREMVTKCLDVWGYKVIK